MIIGLAKENWIEQLENKTVDKYLELVDALVIVGSTQSEEKPYYFVNAGYDYVKKVLEEFSNLKAYPQRTWWSTNYSLAEIEEGVTPQELKRRWINELQTRHLV